MQRGREKKPGCQAVELHEPIEAEPAPHHLPKRRAAKGSQGRLGAEEWEAKGTKPRVFSAISELAVVVKNVLGSHYWVGEFTTHVRTYFSGDWDVQWGYGSLTRGQLRAWSFEAYPCHLGLMGEQQKPKSRLRGRIIVDTYTLQEEVRLGRGLPAPSRWVK